MHSKSINAFKTDLKIQKIRICQEFGEEIVGGGRFVGCRLGFAFTFQRACGDVATSASHHGAFFGSGLFDYWNNLVDSISELGECGGCGEEWGFREWELEGPERMVKVWIGIIDTSPL